MFPVNLQHIFRAPFQKNIYERLRLKFVENDELLQYDDLIATELNGVFKWTCFAYIRYRTLSILHILYYIAYNENIFITNRTSDDFTDPIE